MVPVLDVHFIEISYFFHLIYRLFASATRHAFVTLYRRRLRGRCAAGWAYVLWRSWGNDAHVTIAAVRSINELGESSALRSAFFTTQRISPSPQRRCAIASFAGAGQFDSN